jgi:hypothetical protein
MPLNFYKIRLLGSPLKGILSTRMEQSESIDILYIGRRVI